MNANDVIRRILLREDASPTAISKDMGRQRTYINTILAKNRIPGTSVMADFCEILGYELVVRSKEDGFEFIIDE